MTANAVHPGRITIPGTDLGVRGTLVAEAQTEDMLLTLDDRLALGPVKVDTDSTGTLEVPLTVPIVSGVLWLLRFEPHRGDIAPFVLGVYNLNTSGIDLKDLVVAVPTTIDATVALNIAAAAALGATNDTATASFVANPASATRTAANAVYATKPNTGQQAVGKGELVYLASDYASLSAAVAAVPAGGTLRLTTGTYAANAIKPSLDITIEGAGNRQTIIDAGASNYAIDVPTQGAPNRVTFRNVGFTGGVQACVRLTRNRTTVARFIDCRFSGFNADAISSSGADVIATRCEFDGDGTPGAKRGIFHQFGAARITLEGCRFRYLFRGIYITDASGAPGDVKISGCTFDGGWCYLKATASGSGGTVTYTGTTVTDTGAAFSGITSGDVVRAMAVKRSGTATASAGPLMTDTSGAFVVNGVKHGDIIRTATKWGVVDDIISATQIKVEEWLDLTTYDSVEPPTVGTAYTIYGLVLGKAASSTGTAITVDVWRDWDGVAVTPAAGTLYEVSPQTNYQGAYLAHADRVAVTSSTFRRCYADQLSIQSSRNVIVEGNHFFDGQDVGITLNAGTAYPYNEPVVANNKITHHGSAGIYCNMPNARIIGNSIVEPGWISIPSTTYGAIVLDGASGARVTGNLCKRINHPNALRGLALLGTMAGVHLDNDVVGYTNDMTITGVNVTNVRGTFQPGTTFTLASSAVGPRGEFSGTGVPALACSVGATYRRTDGGASTTFYVKETASSSTVWRAV